MKTYRVNVSKVDVSHVYIQSERELSRDDITQLHDEIFEEVENSFHNGWEGCEQDINNFQEVPGLPTESHILIKA